MRALGKRKHECIRQVVPDYMKQSVSLSRPSVSFSDVCSVISIPSVLDEKVPSVLESDEESYEERRKRPCRVKPSWSEDCVLSTHEWEYVFNQVFAHAEFVGLMESEYFLLQHVYMPWCYIYHTLARFGAMERSVNNKMTIRSIQYFMTNPESGMRLRGMKMLTEWVDAIREKERLQSGGSVNGVMCDRCFKHHRATPALCFATIDSGVYRCVHPY